MGMGLGPRFKYLVFITIHISFLEHSKATASNINTRLVMSRKHALFNCRPALAVVAC